MTEPEPSMEEYCDELGRERYISQERCISILDGITAILEADKNGEAAGKIRKSGCLNIIGKLQKHSDAGISNRGQGILKRCEILQQYAGAGGNGAGGVPRGTSAPSPSSKTRSREGGAKESGVSKAKKDQRLNKSVSQRSGRGRHNPGKTKY